MSNLQRVDLGWEWLLQVLLQLSQRSIVFGIQDLGAVAEVPFLESSEVASEILIHRPGLGGIRQKSGEEPGAANELYRAVSPPLWEAQAEAPGGTD